MILSPDDEHPSGDGYEDETAHPWLEATPGRVLLGHIMLTLLWMALMAAAVALCI